MEEKLRLTYLYDFYGELLNPALEEVFKSYYFSDLSLQEMAEEMGVSRQAVHEKVRRSVKALEGYESRLHLLEKNKRISEIADRIELKLAENPTLQEDSMKELEKLLEDLKEVL